MKTSTMILCAVGAFTMSACSKVSSTTSTGLDYLERGVSYATFGFVHNHDSDDQDHNHNEQPVDTVTAPVPTPSPVVAPAVVASPVVETVPFNDSFIEVPAEPYLGPTSNQNLPPLIALTNSQGTLAGNCICPDGI